jgi:SlyX protein
MPDSRVTELEIALAHQERVAEELSDVVREQAARLDALERRVDRLVARLAGLEEAAAAAPAADVRPPHW